MCVFDWFFFFVLFFKQKTAYEMRISDWSSDVCSSDLFVVLLTAVAVDRFGCVGCVEVRFLIRARGHRCTTFYPPGSARLLPVCALRWVNRWVDRKSVV